TDRCRPDHGDRGIPRRLDASGVDGDVPRRRGRRQRDRRPLPSRRSAAGRRGRRRHPVPTQRAPPSRRKERRPMNTNAARSERDGWLELVAAVDYLSVTHRLGMTVCDAIDEAVRAWTVAQRSEGMLFPIGATDVPWDDPDPLRSTLSELLDAVEPLDAPAGR